MTDLEMTKLCAEAMGYKVVETNWYSPATGEALWIDEIQQSYRPLRDDAQAMALVKKFRLNVGPTWRNAEICQWAASFPVRNGPTRWTWNEDLNRAIVECVATANSARDDGTEQR